VKTRGVYNFQFAVKSKSRVVQRRW